MKVSQEQITPYGNEEKKSIQVERMFDTIAPAYDKLNHTLSFGIDKLWRKKAIKWLKPFHPQLIMDVATGTGDFAIQTYKTILPEQIIATDLSEGMMALGRKKVKEKGLENKIIFRKEDCLTLNFPDDMFDAVTVAFGVRNFENLEQGLSEINRVLKKGGQLVILELSTPETFPMNYLYKIYSKIVIPTLGKLMSKDNSAYRYLPASIEAFPQGKEIKKILESTGFAKTEFETLTFGICTLYKSIK